MLSVAFFLSVETILSASKCCLIRWMVMAVIVATIRSSWVVTDLLQLLLLARVDLIISATAVDKILVASMDK